MDLLKWVIGIFILFGIGWVIIGGTETTQRPFLKPPTPLDSGEQYGPVSNGITIRIPPQESAEEEPNEVLSIFDGKVSFSGRSAAREEDPDDEYLFIEASRNNLQPINISGWRVKSAVTGKSATLGTGTYLYRSGRVANQEAIFLAPGERAYITTGKSPVGTSFRLNMCSGYLEQFQDFSPQIRKQCPLAIDENPPFGTGGLSDSCFDFIEDIRRCEIITSFPLSLDNDCRGFISENINYNACIDNHRTEESFFLPEWRIFLGYDSEFWKERRETILLIDASGKTVDSLSY